MSDALFNKEGVPMFAVGKKISYATKGTAAGAKETTPVRTVEKNENKVTVEDLTIWSWGDENDYPTIADGLINKTGVLRTAIRFRMNLILGSGIYPVKVKSYKDDGAEVLEVINDPEVLTLVKSRMIRNYLQGCLRDKLRLGMAFPEFLMNETGDKIAAIHPINAKYVRLCEKNQKTGIIEKAVVSGIWPDKPNKEQITVVDVLDPVDPLADLERRKAAGKTAGKKFIYMLFDPISNNEYYTTPDWDSARLAGWVDIANKVPTFLSNMYSNQMTLKYHVRIPYAYWDKKFPKSSYKTNDLREAAIKKFLDKIEDALVGEENPRKAIFTMFEVNNQGKAEEKWDIEVLDDKFKNEDQLVTSSAAVSEILFSMMVNPAIVGAMPTGGGPYQTQSGGSNIREAFLVSQALAWLDRQDILDPIETMLAFNYGNKFDAELRFKNVFLTTLDTGGGTGQNLG